ncbi:MAG: hypothetical protein CW716_08210 [Candidatus Bathyarchaeum sp.]|nr:MAG: hypothetical protein CW716_08210 [Candidatus Bathyarchaeum sp.]
MKCPECGLEMDEVSRKDWKKTFRCGTVDTARTLWLPKRELMPFSEFYNEVLLKKSNDTVF